MDDMGDIYEDSLELHRAHRGKLEVTSKVPIGDMHDLALAYTPGVGAVCRAIAEDPARAREYTIAGNTVAIVTDGSAVLGLGNLGAAAAMPVMEGKAILFKKFAGIDAFPLCLATQDTEEIIATVKRIAPAFGGINLEDISAPRCFEIEARLQKELSIPVMHDDRQGTGVVVLAGLINVLKIKNTRAEEMRVVVVGAGAAGTGIVAMLLHHGFRDIVVCDRNGAISTARADLTPEKAALARATNPRGVQGSIADAVRDADIFIGVSTPGILTEDMVRTMRPQPVIFALANPVPEIMPDAAARAGALIVATGRSDFPNQVNNVLAFPGIFRGALDHKIARFEPKMFLAAAERLAACVEHPTPDRILPNVFDKGVAEAVAEAIR